jgi:hypothetical protein
MTGGESRFENRAPSTAIVAFLKGRLKDGRIYNTTKAISEGTGLSRKVIGVRMKNMMDADWTGLVITQWTECVWMVTEVKHGKRGIRETV